jgi:hypothetical protein
MVSMTKYFLDGIDDNVKVWEIGSLFRSITGNKWNINVSFSPPQSIKYTSISNASLLARRRLLRATQTFKKPGYPLNFALSDTTHWEVKTIGECPINDGYSKRRDSGQFCFVFTTPDDITVYLPQFELARILFFHGGYLSRTAIESDCLETYTPGPETRLMLDIIVKNFNESRFNFFVSIRLNRQLLYDFNLCEARDKKRI